MIIARIRCVLINAQVYTDAGCDLAVFTLRTKPDFQMARHHHLVCHYLEMLVSGDIRRLMILMPPRHGKSELVSRRLPAYLRIAVTCFVMDVLGHSSPQTTLKVYSHWFAKTQSDSLDRLSRPLPEILDTFGHFGTIRRVCRNRPGAEVIDFTRESVAPPAGFEPTTPGLGILCSIHLS